MDAVLLVGGQGTRLRPLTISAPKPMLPAAGVPFTAHQLARARDAGVDHVVLATSYRAEVFEEYFGDGSAFGLDLEYVTEVEPMGTGGGIRNVADRLRGGPDDPVPPGWEAHPVSLEELALAYLRSPGAEVLPGPSLVQHTEPTEVAR